MRFFNTAGPVECAILICDRSEGRSWAEKLFRREEVYQGGKITIWGM